MSTVSAMRVAVEEAKQHAFSTCLRTVHRDLVYRDETCGACGVKPWAVNLGDEDERVLRCDSCADEVRIGGALPRVTALSWRRSADTNSLASVDLFAEWQLHLHDSAETARFGAEAVFAIWRPGKEAPPGIPQRFLANYIPRVTRDELENGRYRHIREDTSDQKDGDPKVFEQIAADARLETAPGKWTGVEHLAVLKADVDRLGQVFSPRSGAASLSRYASLSRTMDFFFTGYLHQRLAKNPDFQSTYTVYAGGDDLLLIGPWRQVISLAVDIRRQFSAWTGHNPNITLSAGVELMKVSHPIQRVARAAESRLTKAKEAGRNRVCLIQEAPLAWEQLEELLAKGEELFGYLESDLLPLSFAYRLFYFDDLRERSEGAAMPDKTQSPGGWLDLEAAGWRSLWAYSLARNVKDRLGSKRPGEAQKLMTFLNGLLGLGADLRKGAYGGGAKIPLTVALYKHRGSYEREA
ncbi:MAG: hypothetical protein LC114_03675 [Bryobacterales bacterium]|nr:hypothetical protein [Bryobacterales bacterium]